MKQPFCLPKDKHAGWWVAVVLVCGAFALKVLGLIDATSLWSDELYSVGKSFQPDYGALLAMLRQDTHPPIYYSLLWLWGAAVGQSAVSLRLLSWLAYGLGAVVMVAQVRQLAAPSHRQRAMALAALLAFCSPYPVRFAIEGKSYALLVLLVALGWWLRSRLLLQHARHEEGKVAGFLYGLVVAAAGLTHFYGLFVFLAAAAWDGWQKRWHLPATTVVAVLPALAWIGYASAYLFSSRSASWIGPPDFALFEEILARGLGPWPLPKLLLIGLVVMLIRRWGLRSWGCEEPKKALMSRSLLDRTGVIPSLVMLVAVVVVSFLKPMAFSRYFVVLLPALLPWITLKTAALPLNALGRRTGLLLLAVLLALWWQQSFFGIDAAQTAGREADDFRAVSALTAGQVERFGPRPRLLNLSDRMEQAAGRLQSPPTPWGDEGALIQRLQQHPLPQQLWLAASGPAGVMQKRLRPLQAEVERSGLACEALESPPFTRVLRCRYLWGSVSNFAQ